MRWLNRIENQFRISFDYPEKYLQEYNELGGIPFMTSEIDGEKLMHEDLIVIMSFLNSLIDRTPNIPVKKKAISSCSTTTLPT